VHLRKTTTAVLGGGGESPIIISALDPLLPRGKKGAPETKKKKTTSGRGEEKNRGIFLNGVTKRRGRTWFHPPLSLQSPHRARISLIRREEGNCVLGGLCRLLRAKSGTLPGGRPVSADYGARHPEGKGRSNLSSAPPTREKKQSGSQFLFLKRNKRIPI